MRPSQALNLHRELIRQIVAQNHAVNPRIFGSVVHIRSHVLVEAIPV